MRELCVIYNPAAGKRRAEARLERVRAAWGDRAAFWATDRPGHAADLAQRAAVEGFRTVAAAGGDGTVHDVATGLLLAGRPDVDFAVIPIGSANDFAYAVTKTPGDRVRIDVGRVRAEDGRERRFVCNLGMGFNGAVTDESRRIEWLQGTLLYGLAALRALRRQFDRPNFEVSIDGGQPTREPTLLLAVLNGPREGGFVLAPEAKLDDGQMNLVQAGDLSRAEVLCLLPRLAVFGPPTDRANIRRGVCRTVTVTSERPIHVHVDGEFLCRRHEGLRRFEIEVEPSALSVDVAMTRRGGMPAE